MPQNWTAAEREQLTRLRLAAAMHTPDATMALGLTEQGDPWCTIFSPQTGEVIINIARIAGDYIRMPGSHGAVRSDDLGACIEAFLMLRPLRAGFGGEPVVRTEPPRRERGRTS